MALFNSQLLRSVRKQAGWTQEELAAQSGTSVRVIAKAESGEMVAIRTTNAFVKAFEKAGIAVGLNDFTCDPVALTRKFLTHYAVYQADCVQYCLDFTSPDILAVVDGDPATNPIAGEYRGIEEFDRLWRKFFSIFDRVGGTLVDRPEFRCLGNEVLAWGHEEISLKGVPSKGPGLVLLRLQFKDGKIVRFDDHYEASGMMLALSHYADRFPDAEWAKLLREKPYELP